MVSHYTTVYEISAAEIQAMLTPVKIGIAAFAGVAVLFGLLAIIIGGVLISRKERIPRIVWAVPIVLGLFSGIFALGALPFSRIPKAYLKVLTAYQTGDFQVVEGTVTDFDPMPFTGHKDECFSVQNERFCYSDYLMAPGFRKTASHGGPIRSGLQVRIAYEKMSHHNSILRLEIADDPPTKVP